MYFQELKDLKTKYNIPEDIIDKLDTWLAYLRRSQRKYILPDFFGREYNLQYQVVRELFYYATSLGVLEINYEIHCPFCDEMLNEEIHEILIFQTARLSVIAEKALIQHSILKK